MRICKSLPSLTKNTACRVSSGQVKVEDSVDDEACELVNGVELSIGEGDDSINAYLLKAVKNNNGTGILLLSDVFGFEDHPQGTLHIALPAMVTNLFRGNPWVKDQPKIMFQQWLATQDRQRVARDIDMSVKWLVDEFIAAGVTEKLGVIGFALEAGRVIDVLAQDQGAHFGTGVSFYGTRINPSAAANVKVPVLFISGDEDPLCPVNLLKDIEKSIGRGSRLVIFEGRGHGLLTGQNLPKMMKTQTGVCGPEKLVAGRFGCHFQFFIGNLIVMKVICQYHIFIIFHVAFIQGTIDEEPFDVTSETLLHPRSEAHSIEEFLFW
ncbi:hypothetical protein CK203_031559 [Vitis vinifera]|uniref:Carboxymethylenebutenolidase homolog n=1 Tax=Vitis vinifera TaxID=29760 RepID=A0A438IG27_VITVI|nr:hypothetical protein CK203_031559 [Vitis vinifera]